jgi:hypothetical protein
MKTIFTSFIDKSLLVDEDEEELKMDDQPQ